MFRKFILRIRTNGAIAKTAKARRLAAATRPSTQFGTALLNTTRQESCSKRNYSPSRAVVGTEFHWARRYAAVCCCLTLLTRVDKVCLKRESGRCCGFHVMMSSSGIRYRSLRQQPIILLHKFPLHNKPNLVSPKLFLEKETRLMVSDGDEQEGKIEKLLVAEGKPFLDVSLIPSLYKSHFGKAWKAPGKLQARLKGMPKLSVQTYQSSAYVSLASSRTDVAELLSPSPNIIKELLDLIEPRTQHLSSTGDLDSVLKNDLGEGELSSWISHQRDTLGRSLKNSRHSLVLTLVESKVLAVRGAGKLEWDLERLDPSLCLDAAKQAPSQQMNSKAVSSGTRSGPFQTKTIRSLADLETLVTKLKEDPKPCALSFSWKSSSTLESIAVACSSLKTAFVISASLDGVCRILSDCLFDPTVNAMVHDAYKATRALFPEGRGSDPDTNACVFDTQLAAEFLSADMDCTFGQMLKIVQAPMTDLVQSSSSAIKEAQTLVETYDLWTDQLGSKWTSIFKASSRRLGIARECSGVRRRVGFHVQQNYRLSSFELLEEMQPDSVLVMPKLAVSDESSTLLAIIPDDLMGEIGEHAAHVTDIVLDLGRRPYIWVKGERLYIGDDNRVIADDDITQLTDRLGGFGSDNRAGLERQLHRISAIRNRKEGIVGLTLRMGRYVTGNAAIITDILLQDRTKSILVLGDPGSGKTTVIREMARILSETRNVCIIDTSNEIAGDGDIPHSCIGHSRRMMVPSLDKQSAVMVECVQNHTPDTMIVDEIGRSSEVEAARTSKNRGVRLIGSAHGDLRKLIKNPKLRGLVGGIQSVTLGDEQAKEEAKKKGLDKLQKTKAERAGPPCFEILIELQRGRPHEWRIVFDAGSAVDAILEGDMYKSQVRTRDPETNAVYWSTESA